MSDASDGRKVVIVTGASGGIGEATARLFAERGYAVVLVARSQERLEGIAEELRRAGGEALTVPADLTQREAAGVVARQTVEAYGRIDVLVNNAGRGFQGTVAGLELDDLEALLRLNVLAPVACLQAVVPLMRRQGGGVIVNVSSVAEKAPLPFMAPYSASKIALSYLSDAARLELSRDNIAVVNVLPGNTRTEFGAGVLHSGRDDSLDLRAFMGEPGTSTPHGMAPEAVAEVIWRAVQRRPRQAVVGAGNRAAAVMLHHGRAPLIGLFTWAINRYVPRPGAPARRPQQDIALAGAAVALVASAVAIPLRLRLRSPGTRRRPRSDDVVVGRFEG